MKQIGRKMTRHEAIFLPIYSIISLLSHVVSLCPRLILGDKIDKLQTLIEGYLDGIVAFCTHHTDKSCIGRRLEITCIHVNDLYSRYNGSFIVHVDNFTCGLFLLSFSIPTANL